MHNTQVFPPDPQLLDRRSADHCGTVPERWQIELFFKWIKQHLHIKTFYGTSQNAVYTQIRIAVCDYLLLIIAKKRYGLVPSLHSISDSIGQVLFRRADIRELYNQPTLPVNVPETEAVKQLTLW